MPTGGMASLPAELRTLLPAETKPLAMDFLKHMLAFNPYALAARNPLKVLLSMRGGGVLQHNHVISLPPYMQSDTRAASIYLQLDPHLHGIVFQNPSSNFTASGF